ncbi:MAG: oligosaccharide flippase family protein [Elusimicrobiaceae bacterium]|nr:oligosaccharide flippase family protein [Elusimicrobiaceae bacterium]
MQINNKQSKFIKNTCMLYLLSAAKMLFPFLTFPYLTRVLSVDGYALLAYVKAAMSYMQMWVDFGFMLSATKDIARAGRNIPLINQIVTNTILARVLLGVTGAAALAFLSALIPLLRQNLLFVWLSYVAIFLSCFMTDYLFRGIEQMHEITIRFVTMKGISTALTFVVVHSDADLLYIPILDIVSSAVALILIYFQFGKYNVRLIKPSLRRAWEYLKESAEYFMSHVATTAFGALNTLLIGIFLPEADIAMWSVALQLILVIQMCYGPILDVIYPEMMLHKSLGLIKKLFLIFMPLVGAGCVICYWGAPLLITIAAGDKYMAAVPIFRLLLPVLFLGFPAMLCGWSTLGAIGKIRQTTLTTVISACTQCAGLGILILGGMFTVPMVAVVRDITESVLLGTRVSLVIKYRKEFS